MNENNQYGNTMTKSLPYGWIKKSKKVPSLCEFNLILSSICHEDKVGDLFIVDIKFHKKKNEKALLFKEIHAPTFEKNKVIKPYERSVLQLLSALNWNEQKDIINSFKYNAKTQSTMDEKKFIPLYAEHIHFLVKRAE